MQASEIKASRMYSWIVENEAKMLVGGKARTNPLADLVVTKRCVYAGQAATGAMWLKAQLALNPAYTPSDRAPQHEPTENDCIVRNIASGELQVRIMNFRTNKREYFVGGIPATENELATIAQYSPKHSRNDLFAPVMFPYLHNITNADNDIAPIVDLKSLAFKPVTTADIPVVA